jgi:hypothetical protein
MTKRCHPEYIGGGHRHHVIVVDTWEVNEESLITVQVRCHYCSQENLLLLNFIEARQFQKLLSEVLDAPAPDSPPPGGLDHEQHQ